jgi:hypothetical protein
MTVCTNILSLCSTNVLSRSQQWLEQCTHSPELLGPPTLCKTEYVSSPGFRKLLTKLCLSVHVLGSDQTKPWSRDAQNETSFPIEPDKRDRIAITVRVQYLCQVIYSLAFFTLFICGSQSGMLIDTQILCNPFCLNKC